MSTDLKSEQNNKIANKVASPRIVHHIITNEFDAADVMDIFWNPNEIMELLNLSHGALTVKRVLDFLASVVLAVVLIPLFFIIAIVIKLDSPGPVLFRQMRVGKNGKQFRFYKFRTMVKDAEQQREGIVSLNEATGPMFKVKNDPRITRASAFLRKTSLDELPQIINVIRGEMSLVGPRPALPNEVKEYNALGMKRLLVMPGMTGEWQVNGRSDSTFEDMIKNDMDYIKNWSIWLDIKIMIKTIPVIIYRRGAY